MTCEHPVIKMVGPQHCDNITLCDNNEWFSLADGINAAMINDIPSELGFVSYE